MRSKQAVQAGKIPFIAIGDLIEEALNDIVNKENYTLSDVEEVSHAARERVQKISGKYRV